MNIWVEVLITTIASLGLLFFCGWGLTFRLSPEGWKKYQYLMMPFAGLFVIDSLTHFTSVVGLGGHQSIWIILLVALIINLATAPKIALIRYPNRKELFAALGAFPILLLALIPVMSVGMLLPVGDTNADPISHTATTDFLQLNSMSSSVPVDSEHPVYVPVHGKVKTNLRLGFHFYQMYVNLITNRGSYATFPIVIAVGLYLWSMSIWLVMRGMWKLSPLKAYLAEVVFAFSALPLWIGYGGYGPQVLGMGLLVLTFGAWGEVLRTSYNFRVTLWAAMFSAALAGIYAEALPYALGPIVVLFGVYLFRSSRDKLFCLFKTTLLGGGITLLINPVGWWRALARVLVVTTNPNMGNVDKFIGLPQVFGLLPFATDFSSSLFEVLSSTWVGNLFLALFSVIIFALAIYASFIYKGASHLLIRVGIIVYSISLGWFLIKPFPYGYFKGWSMALYLFIILFVYGAVELALNRKISRMIRWFVILIVTGYVFCVIYSGVTLAHMQRHHFACSPGIVQVQEIDQYISPDEPVYIVTDSLSPVSEFWVAYFLREQRVRFDSPVIYTSYDGWPYTGEQWVLQHHESNLSSLEPVRGLKRHWSGESFDLWEVYVEGLISVRTMENSAFVQFGTEIELLGYDARCDNLNPGDDLDFTLYWSAEEDINHSYKVFAHLMDSSGTLITQSDGYPVLWSYPTDLWSLEKIIVDPHRISLSSDISPGNYGLFVGLYLESSGDRLAIRDSQGTMLNNAFVLCEFVID